MGVGLAKQDSKVLKAAREQLATIAGQQPSVRRARKSIAAFKLREGMPVGVAVTLRAERGYEFLDRLVSIAIPRIRDFRGLNPRSFDGRGNYSMGVREQIIFPEIDYDAIDEVRGLDITITTTAATDAEAFALLSALGMPFAAQGRPAGFDVGRTRPSRGGRRAARRRSAGRAAEDAAEQPRDARRRRGATSRATQPSEHAADEDASSREPRPRRGEPRRGSPPPSRPGRPRTRRPRRGRRQPAEQDDDPHGWPRMPRRPRRDRDRQAAVKRRRRCGRKPTTSRARQRVRAQRRGHRREREHRLMAKTSLRVKQTRTPKFKTRAYTRCNRCGRPRAVYRKFGVCRICLRELAHNGQIPGMTKSSW